VSVHGGSAAQASGTRYRSQEDPPTSTPAHRASIRGLEGLTYPLHDQADRRHTVLADLLQRAEMNLSHVFAGENVGVTQVGDRIWLVTFMQYDLGYFDDETCRLEQITNPFGPKVLPMSAE
jgi:putative transposase